MNGTLGMSDLKPCEGFVAQLGARAVGGLDEPAGAALEAHLAGGCAGCAALAAELEAELDLARLPEEDPAPGGWERVLLRLDGAAPAAPDVPAPVVRLRCAYCHDDLRRAEAACCAACLAPHHPDCVAGHGRCAAPGCAETRVLRAGAPPAPTVTRPARPRLRLLLGLIVGSGGVAALAEVSRRGEVAGQERAEQRAAERVIEMQRLLAEYQAAGPARVAEPTYDGKPLSHWIQVLADRSQGYRDGALVALQAMGDAAVPALLQALEAENVVQRQSAARALREMRAPQAMPALLRRSRDDPDTEVRVQAVHALVGVAQGASRQVQEAALVGLTGAARDPQREVRYAAVQAARSLVHLPGTQALWRASLSSDADLQVREHAAEQLADLLEGSPIQPDAEPLQALLQALRADPHPGVRCVIAERLADDSLREDPAQASIADALARALADPAPEVREQAVRSLESFDLAPRHLEALLEALPNTPLASELLRRASLERLAQLVPELSRRSEAVQAEFLGVLDRILWERDETSLLFDAVAGYFSQAPSPELRLATAWILDKASHGRPDRRARGQEAVRVVEGDVTSVLAPAPLVDEPLPVWFAVELAGKLGTAARAAAPGLAAIARCRELPDSRRGRALETLVAVAPVDSATETAVVEALQAGAGDVLAGHALLAVAQAPAGALQGEACRRVLLQRAPVWLARDEAPSRGTRANLLRALVHIDPTAEELRPLERLLRGLPDAETKQDGSVAVLEKQALLSRLR